MKKLSWKAARASNSFHKCFLKITTASLGRR